LFHLELDRVSNLQGYLQGSEIWGKLPRAIQVRLLTRMGMIEKNPYLGLIHLTNHCFHVNTK
jgi:hypothetical protein